MHPLSDIARSHGLSFHCYADDTQLYIAFNSADPVETESARSILKTCVNDINNKTDKRHDNKGCTRKLPMCIVLGNQKVLPSTFFTKDPPPRGFSFTYFATTALCRKTGQITCGYRVS